MTGEDGIGNFRIEVAGGTLDLTSIDPGEVIGRTKTDEATQFGNFRVLGEVRAVAKSGNVVDFDIVLTELSPVALQVLTYNPLDAAHSHGILYRGKLTANGAGGGFVFDYRYEQEEEACSPAIEPNDAVGPGFNARLAFSLFTDAAATAFTLPNAPSLSIVSTLRKFTEMSGPNCPRDPAPSSPVNHYVANPDEILPLGAPDLCVVVVEPEPCRMFEEELSLSTGVEPNNPPVAEIVPTDQLGQPLIDGTVFIDCGVGRVVLRGSNSTDGDGGSQGITYLWEVVAGPKSGAAITSDPTFMDANLSCYLAGEYTIRLTVNDGQTENNTDTAEVRITAQDGLGPNLPPEITSLTYRPAGGGGPEVELLGGDLRIELVLAGPEVTLVDLDADGNSGADGCQQNLLVTWTRPSGPAEVTISDPFDDDTEVTFTQLGEYVIRVTADDLAPEDNVAMIDVTVVVREPGVGPFLRGDCNGDGLVGGTVTDPVVMLNFNFLGAVEPPCIAACDANGDGSFRGTVTDAVFLLNFSFLGGPMPPEPRACTLSNDPDDVELGCDSNEGCAGG